MENKTCKAVLQSFKANYSLARCENYYKTSQGFSYEISEQLALCFLFYNRIPLLYLKKIVKTTREIIYPQRIIL